MIAKVIAHAPTRAAAARRLAAGLAQAEIHGPPTNRDLLVAVLRDADFLAGATRTDFLDRHPHLRTPAPATPPVVHLAAAVACTSAARREHDPRAHLAPPGWRTLRGAPRPTVHWAGPDGEVAVRSTIRPDAIALDVDGVEHTLGLRDLTADGRSASPTTASSTAAASPSTTGPRTSTTPRATAPGGSCRACPPPTPRRAGRGRSARSRARSSRSSSARASRSSPARSSSSSRP